MRRLAQATTIVCALGLVLAGAGTAHAQTGPRSQAQPQQSLLSLLVGFDLSSLGDAVSGVLCDNHLVDYRYKSPADHAPHPCINGPAHSDNRLNSGNFSNLGNPYHTGNISDVNGPADSGNSQDSGNFLNQGNPADSGNIANTNGSTNSGNTVMGNRMGASGGGTSQRPSGAPKRRQAAAPRR